MANGEIKLYLSHVEAKWQDQSGNTRNTTMRGDSNGAIKAKEAFHPLGRRRDFDRLDFDRVHRPLQRQLRQRRHANGLRQQVHHPSSPRMA
jgi:hypothetical protein